MSAGECGYVHASVCEIRHEVQMQRERSNFFECTLEQLSNCSSVLRVLR